VKVIINNLQKKIPIYPKRIKKAILKTLSKERIKKSGEITVCFVNDKEIRELNLMYLAKNTPTDVIAFDNSSNKKILLGDIAISTDTAIRNARIFKTSNFHEIYLYVIHGVLHLLGYDDTSKKDRLIMQKREEFLLKTLKPIT
jgi:probable rRNA maturation factor